MPHLDHRTPAVAAAPILYALGLLVGFAGTLPAAPLVDDRAVTLHSPREVTERRRSLIRFLWGTSDLPSKRQPDSVRTIPSPVSHLTNLARVDELRIDLAPGLQGIAYHFIPERANRELVVVHHGHACTLEDDPSPHDVGYGLQRTIHALLAEGYGVLGVFMPHLRPGDCTGGHDALMRTNTTGSPIKWFLEPTLIGLNHVQTQSRVGRFPRYRAFHMTGLSGGGWTTTVYAAIDPRIRCSVPIAGTLPLYLRWGGSVGDGEQIEPTFYRLAGYPDLYVLGAHGRGRRQVQVLVQRDDCCFGEAQHNPAAAGAGYRESLHEYERRVQDALRRMGAGDFRVEIDDTAPSHMISHHVIEHVLLAELRRGR